MIDLGKYLIKISRYSNKIKQITTVSHVFDKKTHKLLSVGMVTCSKNDCFNKKIGRKKAIANALNKSSISKENRETLWQNYRTKMTKKPRW